MSAGAAPRSLRARFALVLGVTLALVGGLPLVLYFEAARHVRALLVPVGAADATIDQVLGPIAISCAMLGMSAVLLVIAVALWQARQAYVPLQQAAAALAGAGSEGLPDAMALPAEIAPFLVHLARLQTRLNGALEREREFTGHVAHELRTPLAVLNTGLELVVRKQTPGTDAHAHTRDMLETVDEMRRLIDNLLLLARVERGAENTKLEPVEVRPLVDAIWQRLADKAHGRALELDNRLPDDFVLPADRGKLRMVIQNLLANAVSYTERGGKIVVSTGPSDRLAVWDSGPQLPDEQLVRVFDRLWRADVARTDAGQHAGIGLSLARALARQMAMDLVARNPASGGVSFVLVGADAASLAAPA